MIVGSIAGIGAGLVALFAVVVAFLGTGQVN
jgi:hypothetical protein